MPRIPQGPIDLIAGYTVIRATPGDPPQDDYYEMGNYTIWGVGLITFGPHTAAQQALETDVGIEGADRAGAIRPAEDDIGLAGVVALGIVARGADGDIGAAIIFAS